jgi:hypothetical protein
MNNYIRAGSISTRDPETGNMVLIILWIDPNEVLNELGSKALKNKSRRTRLCNGAIKVTIQDDNEYESP